MNLGGRERPAVGLEALGMPRLCLWTPRLQIFTHLRELVSDSPNSVWAGDQGADVIAPPESAQ